MSIEMEGDWGGYTAAQCFLPNLTFSDQVACNAQHLNVSDPAS